MLLCNNMKNCKNSAFIDFVNVYIALNPHGNEVKVFLSNACL